ncbi:hypothetical protein Tcan_12946, partial [Toxocara canis]
HLQMLLQDHIDHLHNIYYTLYLNGFSTLKFPDGEKVDLSQFRGIELGLVQREAPKMLRRPESARGPPLSPVLVKDDQRSCQNAVDELSELASTLLRNRDAETDRQSEWSHNQSDHDKEELRVAMLKCITKSKYDDVDDYLQWLNDCTSTTSKLPARRELWGEQLSDVDEMEREGCRSEDGSRKEQSDADQSRKCSFENERYRRSESESSGKSTAYFAETKADQAQTTSKLPARRELWGEQLSDVDEMEREGCRSEDGSRKEQSDADQSRKCSFENERYRRSESESRVNTDPSNNADEVGRAQRTSPKQRPTRHRAMSVGCNKLNGFISARQCGNAKKPAPRRSLVLQAFGPCTPEASYCASRVVTSSGWRTPIIELFEWYCENEQNVTAYLKRPVPPSQGCYSYARDEHLCFCNRDTCNTRQNILAIFTRYADGLRRVAEATKARLTRLERQRAQEGNAERDPSTTIQTNVRPQIEQENVKRENDAGKAIVGVLSNLRKKTVLARAEKLRLRELKRQQAIKLAAEKERRVQIKHEEALREDNRRRLELKQAQREKENQKKDETLKHQKDEESETKEDEIVQEQSTGKNETVVKEMETKHEIDDSIPDITAVNLLGNITVEPAQIVFVNNGTTTV